MCVLYLRRDTGLHTLCLLDIKTKVMGAHAYADIRTQPSTRKHTHAHSNT